MPAKQKILSILDRARNAMEESYGGYEEAAYEAPPPPHYDTYAYTPHPHQAAPTSRSTRYEVPEYESSEYRRDYYHREATSYPGKLIWFINFSLFLNKLFDIRHFYLKRIYEYKLFNICE